MKNLRPLLPVLLALLALTALDQWTKHAIFSQWLKGHEEHVFIKGFFSFKAVENRGIVFGLFQGAGKIPLLALTLTAFGLMAWWAVRFWKKPLFRVAASMIASGAVGNLLDRVRLGFVRDFIDFKFWYTFNVADVLIVCGTALFMWLMLTYKEPSEETPPASAAAPNTKTT